MSYDTGLTTTVGPGWGNLAKVWRCNGRYWLFYSDGTNAKWSSSLNGYAWDAAQTLRATCTSGNSLSTWCDGTYIHYAYSAGGNIYYRRGLLNSDGTITWSAAEQDTGQDEDLGGYTSICVDSNGYAFVGFMDSSKPYVLKNANLDGTWSSDGSAVELNAATDASWVVGLVLTNGVAYAFYNTDGGSTYGRKHTSGTTWGSEETCHGAVPSSGTSRATSDSDGTIFLQFNASISYDHYVASRNPSTGVWTTSAALETAGGSNDYSYGMCAHTSKDLYVFTALAGGDLRMKMRPYGGSWDANWKIIATTDCRDGGRVLTCYATESVVWGIYSGTASPYHLYFFEVPILTDALALADALLTDRTLYLTESSSLAEAMYAHKTLLPTDNVALTDVASTPSRTLMPTDSLTYDNEIVYAHKTLLPTDALSLVDAIYEYKPIRFYEMISSFAPSGTSWKDYDIFTNLGVPKGAVALIVMANGQAAVSNYMGVRKDGGSLSRYILLHEAEDGGYNCASMYVQVDAITGLIETYCSSVTNAQFYCLGYWLGVDFTEMYSDITGTSFAWTDKDLYTLYSVPKGSVCQVQISNFHNDAPSIVGARTNGSSLLRYISLHEAESATTEYLDATALSFCVKTSYAGIIETYTSNSTYGKVHLLGYFGPEMDYEEKAYTKFPSNTTANIWSDEDISGSIYEDGQVADLVLSNNYINSTGSEFNLGARINGSGLSRYILIHENEPSSGHLGYNCPTKTDSDGKVEIYYGQNTNYSLGLYGLMGFFYDSFERFILETATLTEEVRTPLWIPHVEDEVGVGTQYFAMVASIGSFGSGNDEFDMPSGVASDGTHIYVADTQNSRIVKRLASDLSYVAQIGANGAGNDEFNYPFDLAVDATHLFVADTYNFRIVKRLASDLSYVGEVGSVYAMGIDVDDTYVYAADQSNNSVNRYLKSDLSYVDQITIFNVDQTFTAPEGVAADGTYLYVADTQGYRVVRFLLLDLSYVDEVGTYGSGNDEFKYPVGLAVKNEHLYVADSDNSRIVKRLVSDLSYVDEFSTASPYHHKIFGSYLYGVNRTSISINKFDISDANETVLAHKTLLPDDTVALTESTDTPTKTIILSELASLAEALVLDKNLTVEDALAFALEVIYVSEGEENIEVIDAIALAEAILLDADVSVAEAVALAEALLLHATLPITDSGLLTDVASTDKTLLPSDAIALADVTSTPTKQVYPTDEMYIGGGYEELTTGNVSEISIGPSDDWVGQKKTFSNKTITRIGFRLRRGGSCPYSYYFGIQNLAGATIWEKNMGLANDTLTTTMQWVYYDLTPSERPTINGTVRFYVKYQQESPSYLYISYAFLGSVKPDELQSRANWLGAWTDYATNETHYKIWYEEAVLINKTPTTAIDSSSLAEVFLLDKTLYPQEAVQASDAPMVDKTLLLQDITSIAEQLVLDANMTASEAIALAESFYWAFNVDDAASATDDALAHKTLHLTDPLVLADLILGGKTLALTDSLGLTEVPFIHKTFYMTETGSLTEVFLLDKMLYPADAIATSEAPMVDKTLLLSDLAELSDEAAVDKTLTLLDYITLVDVVYIEGAVKYVEEAISLADWLYADKTLSLTDAIALADIILAHKNLLLTDSSSIADASRVDKTLPLEDVLALAEVFLLDKTLYPADVVAASEAPQVDKTLPIEDYATVGDAIWACLCLQKVLVHKTLPINDEYVRIGDWDGAHPDYEVIEVTTGAVIHIIEEAIAMAELLLINKSLTAASDSFSLSEEAYTDKGLVLVDASILTEVFILDKDLYTPEQIAASDAPMVDKELLLAEAFALAEAVSLDKSLSITEVLNLVDDLLVNKSLYLIESLSLAEVFLLNKDLYTSEQIQAAEAPMVDKTLPLTDALLVYESALAHKNLILTEDLALADLLYAHKTFSLTEYLYLLDQSYVHKSLFVTDLAILLDALKLDKSLIATDVNLLDDSALAHKGLILTDASILAETFLLDKELYTAEQILASEAPMVNKELLLSDYAYLSESALVDKVLYLLDVVALVDAVLVSGEIKEVLEAIGIVEALLTDKSLLTAETTSLAEAFILDKDLYTPEQIAASDAPQVDKTLPLYDYLSLAELLYAHKTLNIIDLTTLLELALAHKELRLIDTASLMEAFILDKDLYTSEQILSSDAPKVDKELLLTEAFALAEAMYVHKTLPLTDVISLVDELLLNKSLILSEALSLAEVFLLNKDLYTQEQVLASEAPMVDKVLQLLEALGLGEIASTPLKDVFPFDSILLTDTVDVWGVIREVIDSIILTDQTLVDKWLYIQDLIDIEDRLGGQDVYVYEGFGVNDYLFVHKQLILTELAQLIDGVYLHALQDVFENLYTTDGALAHKGLILNEYANLGEEVYRDRSALISDTLGLLEEALAHKGLLLTDPIGLTDSMLLNKALLLQDALTVIEELLAHKGLTLQDDLALTDALFLDKNLILEDILGSLDELLVHKDLLLADQIILDDIVLIIKAMLVLDTITLTEEDINVLKVLVVQDAIALLDALLAHKGIIIGEGIGLDELVPGSGVLIGETITITEEVIKRALCALRIYCGEYPRSYYDDRYSNSFGNKVM